MQQRRKIAEVSKGNTGKWLCVLKARNGKMLCELPPKEKQSKLIHLVQENFPDFKVLIK